jgi:DNA modification methylase
VSASWELREGHVLDRLGEMDDESVHCCITSPPYFGLRDYGTGTWVGGDEACDHLAPMPGGTKASTLGEYDNGLTDASIEQKVTDRRAQYSEECRKCGATRVDEQIGLEPTPDEYVAKLVDVFREVARVLRDDGTLWLNLGDSYARSAGPRHGNFGRSAKGIGLPEDRDSRRAKPWAKSKDLLGIPWIVAFALRADGWYLRSEIIWHKPNPMPSSAADRPTVAHETVFLLAKSERYFYDAVAIRDPGESYRVKSPDGWDTSSGAHGEIHCNGREKGERRDELRSGANKRSVWTVATRPYPDAHFATFPPRLIEPMVLAGCPGQCCSSCGAPWERLTETTYENPGNRTTNGPRSTERKHLEHGSAGYDQRLEKHVATLGWQPTCEHEESTGGGSRA